jgi:hypothetical protein
LTADLERRRVVVEELVICAAAAAADAVEEAIAVDVGELGRRSARRHARGHGEDSWRSLVEDVRRRREAAGRRRVERVPEDDEVVETVAIDVADGHVDRSAARIERELDVRADYPPL